MTVDNVGQLVATELEIFRCSYGLKATRLVRAGNVELSIQMCYVLSSQANNELVPYAVLTMMFINKMPGSVNSKLRLAQYVVNCFNR